jgi:hypothetical protein
MPTDTTTLSTSTSNATHMRFVRHFFFFLLIIYSTFQVMCETTEILTQTLPSENLIPQYSKKKYTHSMGVSIAGFE